jgi:hypothetical protein
MKKKKACEEWKKKKKKNTQGMEKNAKTKYIRKITIISPQRVLEYC